MGERTSSYATAGRALRVSGALKPHHHNKVETPSVGVLMIMNSKLGEIWQETALTLKVPWYNRLPGRYLKQLPQEYKSDMLHCANLIGFQVNFYPR
jgi:hypothetical protein